VLSPRENAGSARYTRVAPENEVIWQNENGKRALVAALTEAPHLQQAGAAAWLNRPYYAVQYAGSMRTTR